MLNLHSTVPRKYHYLPLHLCRICSDPTAATSRMDKPIPQLPDSLDPFLTLLDEPAGLPVCCECQASVLPKSLLDHLRKQHQLPIELRGAVRSLVASLPSWDFDDVPKKPDGSAPVDALRVVSALQCKYCPFIRRDPTDMRRHINQEHQLSAAGSYDQVQAQSWFGGRRTVYWRVCIAPKRVAREEPPCVWGWFGEGWGNRRPTAWLQLSEGDVVQPQE